jgi:sulfide:quinone oxidoreductase
MSRSKKVRAIFTHPNTPIKCGGAPKKIMYLFEHYVRREGNIKNVEIVFAANGAKHFGVPEYEVVVKEQFKTRNIVEKFKHNLVKVDPNAKKATFVHTYEEQGEYDELLEMHDTIIKKEYVTMSYDFLHITPPMHASDAVKNSDLSWQKGANGVYGFVEVDDQTLQHKRYENVFAAGDVIGTMYGKTGGSVRKQAPVVAQNILHVIEGKIEREHYDGYTVCPIITGYGSVLLAEFNYQGITSSFPLDSTKERWLWWILKVYMLKPMYVHGMLKGRM